MPGHLNGCHPGCRFDNLAGNWHPSTGALGVQGAEEDVRVLKGSLEAADASKATAETQLQAARSENRDILVRTVVRVRILGCATSASR
jgi:hypothetical protein